MANLTVNVFLSTHCQFSIIGQEFSRTGWGFAFPRDSPLAVDLSTSILHLAENVDVQRIHDKWFSKSACSSQGTKEFNFVWDYFKSCYSAPYVNIGVLFSFNSTIGKVVKVSVDAAVEDVNSDPSILRGTKLKLTMQDTNYSGFLAMLEGGKLAEKRCKLSYKAPLSPTANPDEITNALATVALMESRVIVLHLYDDDSLQVLGVARDLGMIKSEYVWIATDWLSSVLDTNSLLPLGVYDNIQGVLTLRKYTPDNEQKREFVTRWKKNLTLNGLIGLNAYGLYAYDTVWLLANAIDAFFNQGGNISFSRDAKLSNIQGKDLHFDAVSTFNGGNLLLHNILQVNITGVIGLMRFTSDRNLINPAYEVINVIGTGSRRIGYWSNYSGLSVVPPEELYNKPNKPSGWVFANNGEHLRIGVPIQTRYPEIVSHEKGTNEFSGFCIDVFYAALKLLPYALGHNLVPFDSKKNYKADDLLQLVPAGEYHAAVGDFSITTDRMRLIDFTQPYMDSGLVLVAPIRKLNSSAWVFLRPFTPTMWCVTGIFFLIVGVVVWILEHRQNDDFRGPPVIQINTILWFTFSTLFFSHREKTVSYIGRFVLIIWLFVVLILTSSYTASLTSILTVEQLSSPVKDIQSLIISSEPIGYNRVSFVESYLTDQFKIDKSRLVPLNSPEEFEKALT
ncbi:hypothetical protein Pint_28730 [Pistacia integerrima]|uniref:Uncharacterized protein n=1 Tax=Pistacia integerrima TaxID=434235 RepID=A0ACC0YPE4_9ROSI|nr:hypothetical protein Pint_28730 [Pistacia integerrima]